VKNPNNGTDSNKLTIGKIITTRKTGSLLQGYKPYVLASVSRRWLLCIKAKLLLSLLRPL
ncbi:hypothetical protein ACEWFP_06450, partial [Lactiplantibacillus plantarum]|uniref:hypothetical protein n=1 Tax=Lactiplantibacillus plantarum TaxID=1590 RepID=UPI002436D329